VYHLSDRTLPEYVAALERFDPKVIAGYTSAVHRVATHLLATGDVGRIRPTAILVSSETLLPAARADMEAAFRCRVVNSYSLGELVAYISECDCGELHASTEYGVTELVEVDGRHEIVATGLINRGMPLLRYRTGDLAEPPTGEASLCGRGLPRVEDLTGRIDDVVRTPEGAVVGPAPMSLAFQKVANLRRAQVRQDAIESITVLIETAPEFSDADEALLLSELRRRLGDGLRIDLERVDQLARTSGGKERLVLSSLARPGLS
jgi:phenylacetate-CoA ligase